MSEYTEVRCTVCWTVTSYEETSPWVTGATTNAQFWIEDPAVKWIVNEIVLSAYTRTRTRTTGTTHTCSCKFLAEGTDRTTAPVAFVSQGLEAVAPWPPSLMSG